MTQFGTILGEELLAGGRAVIDEENAPTEAVTQARARIVEPKDVSVYIFGSGRVVTHG